MKQYKQIIIIVALFSIVLSLLFIMRNPIEILYFLFFMSIAFAARLHNNNLARKKKISKIEKWTEIYTIPMLMRWDQPYLYIWAKWGWGFDYLMLPQNMSLLNRIDQIVLWTQNTTGIRTILRKDKMESFEDLIQLIEFIIWSVHPIGIIGNKTRYSMDFGSRRLNIITQANWAVLTITF